MDADGFSQIVCFRCLSNTGIFFRCGRLRGILPCDYVLCSSCRESGYDCYYEGKQHWRKPIPKEYCQSCLDAAYDEGAENKLEAEMLLRDLGLELPDHLCSNVEVEPGVCACPCKMEG